MNSAERKASSPDVVLGTSGKDVLPNGRRSRLQAAGEAGTNVTS